GRAHFDVGFLVKKDDQRPGLGHNLFSVGQFCDKGLEVAFRKSTCFVRNEDGVDLLTGDLSSNLYTIALNEVSSNSSTCLLAKASSSQSWLWHQRLSHLNFATINNFVKNNLVQGLPKMKFKKDHLTPQQNGVVERRNRTLVEAARTMLTFANLPSFLWAEAIATACFTQNRLIIHKRFDKTPYELINKRKPNIKFFRVFGCRCYLLNDYKDVGKLKAKGDIGVFVGYSKESAAFKIYNKRTRKIHESVNVNFDEILEMASKQFSLEPGLSKLNESGKSLNRSVSKVMKSSTMNVETPINEEVFHEVFESFQGESSSSSLNDDVQQSPKKTFYQPYLHEKKWTKDHQFHKIIGDPKSSVRTRGINYDEMFAPVTRIEAIRLFLAYAAHKDFTVFQINVMTTFLNGILKEEVYVGQPPGFVSKQYPDHVYALDKALYGLKQAPRARYDVLSQFLIESGFQKGSIDTTLFIKNKDLMVKRFKMSMMGEMKFFLRLQVNLFSNGIFINQSKYILDILKRFGLENCDSVPTPMVEQAKLELDLVGKPVYHTDYRSMIGSLILLKIQVAQKKFMIAFENADSCLKVELIPSKIKYAIKVVLNFHKEFSVFSSLSRKENDGLLQRSSVQE
nr:hypothetical protein [Tanacetum cinerariifolium]